MTLPRYGRGVLVAGGVGNPPESPLRSVEFLPLVITETSARPRGLPRIRFKERLDINCLLFNNRYCSLWYYRIPDLRAPRGGKANHLFLPKYL